MHHRNFPVASREDGLSNMANQWNSIMAEIGLKEAGEFSRLAWSHWVWLIRGEAAQPCGVCNPSTYLLSFTDKSIQAKCFLRNSAHHWCNATALRSGDLSLDGIYCSSCIYFSGPIMPGQQVISTDIAQPARDIRVVGIQLQRAPIAFLLSSIFKLVFSNTVRFENLLEIWLLQK